jgi:alpha-L-fucosidase
VRWAGNENGMARETEWSLVGLNKPEEEFTWPDMTGKILGDRATLAKAAALHWYPAEADVSILPGWFYHDDRNMKSAQKLLELYEKSIGHNATLILNVPPDRRGLFTDAEVATLKSFGELRQSRYANNLAAGATVTASSSLPDHRASDASDGKYETYWEAAPRTDSDAAITLDIKLPHPVSFTRIVMQEQIRRGQRVEAFAIEVQQPDRSWANLISATTIGYKRILPVAQTRADHLRIRFESYRVAPTLAELGLYN